VSYFVGSWVGGIVPVLMIAALLGAVLRLITKMPAAKALGLCALPAGAVSAAIYGFSSTPSDSMTPFLEGAIVYGVPAMGVFVFGLVYSAINRSPVTVRPSVTNIQEPGVEFAQKHARPSSIAHELASRETEKAASRPKKRLDGVMRIRIVLASALWLIGMSIFSNWLFETCDDLHRYSSAADGDVSLLSSYEIPPIRDQDGSLLSSGASPPIRGDDGPWTKYNRFAKYVGTNPSQIAHYEIKRDEYQTQLSFWPLGFILTLAAPALFWILGSILGWIVRGFRQP